MTQQVNQPLNFPSRSGFVEGPRSQGILGSPVAPVRTGLVLEGAEGVVDTSLIRQEEPSNYGHWIALGALAALGAFLYFR